MPAPVRQRRPTELAGSISLLRRQEEVPCLSWCVRDESDHSDNPRQQSRRFGRTGSAAKGLV